MRFVSVRAVFLSREAGLILPVSPVHTYASSGWFPCPGEHSAAVVFRRDVWLPLLQTLQESVGKGDQGRAVELIFTACV